MDKRGDTMILETSVFIVLNIVFFVVMLVFVYSSSHSAFVYEQVYSKEIALMIDNAKPGMTLFLDFGKCVEIANKNKVKLDDVVRIDADKVVVSLSGKGGHSFEYFSDYGVSEEIQEDKLILIIGEKNAEG